MQDINKRRKLFSICLDILYEQSLVLFGVLKKILSIESAQKDA